MVNSTSSLASLVTYFKAKRREAILSHFPANVGKHFRTQLQASSFDGEFLFEDSVLQRILVESREDSAVSANVALTKVINLPVFGAGKTASKASTEQSSSASGTTATPPVFTYRGRGRGAGRGQKRKNNNNSQPGNASKSTRGGSNASRGRGFTQ